MAEQQHDLAGLPGPALQPFAPARQARVIPAIQRGNRKLHQAEPGGGGRHAWQVLWQAAQRLLHAVVGTLEQAQACRPVVVRQQRQHRLGATAQRHQNGVLQCGGGGQHAGAEQVGRRTAGRDDPVQAAPAHLTELRRQSGYGKVGCCHAGSFQRPSTGRKARWRRRCGEGKVISMTHITFMFLYGHDSSDLHVCGIKTQSTPPAEQATCRAVLSDGKSGVTRTGS
ncbi:hypothetical protein G6F22_016260 [Rhizopus arrhizus]|nr:hypothetical protein G6F22_016260 [Rhizopus arrhizus]